MSQVVAKSADRVTESPNPEKEGKKLNTVAMQTEADIQMVLGLDNEQLVELVQDRKVPPGLERENLITLLCEATDIAGLYDVREVVEALVLALLSRKHIVLYGSKGRGKSELSRGLLEWISGETVFIKSLSADTDARDLFGGPDVVKLADPVNPEFRTMFERGFGAYKYVIFEEGFDAPPHTLSALKDSLTSGYYRDGHQVEKLQTELAVICTNKSPEEYTALYGSDQSRLAFLDRFPLGFHVKGPRSDVNSMEKMLQTWENRKPVPDSLLQRIRAVFRIWRAKVDVRKMINAERQLYVTVIDEASRKEGMDTSPRMVGNIMSSVLQAAAVMNRHQVIDADDYGRLELITEVRNITSLTSIKSLQDKKRQQELDNLELSARSFCVAQSRSLQDRAKQAIADADAITDAWRRQKPGETNPVNTKPVEVVIGSLYHLAEQSEQYCQELNAQSSEVKTSVDEIPAFEDISRELRKTQGLLNQTAEKLMASLVSSKSSFGPVVSLSGEDEDCPMNKFKAALGSRGVTLELEDDEE